MCPERRLTCCWDGAYADCCHALTGLLWYQNHNDWSAAGKLSAAPPLLETVIPKGVTNDRVPPTA
jgi:hypothetical protein